LQSKLNYNILTLNLKLKYFKFRCPIALLGKNDFIPKNKLHLSYTYFVYSIKHILDKNNLNDKHFIFVDVNLINNLNISSPRKLENSVIYTNKYGLLTQIRLSKESYTFI
jgi:hypothetical protein